MMHAKAISEAETSLFPPPLRKAARIIFHGILQVVQVVNMGAADLLAKQTADMQLSCSLCHVDGAAFQHIPSKVSWQSPVQRRAER